MEFEPFKLLSFYPSSDIYMYAHSKSFKKHQEIAIWQAYILYIWMGLRDL